MHYVWNSTRAESNIESLCNHVKEVNIVPYKRSLDLGAIPVNKAYEMNAVHLYVDILNLDKILVTESGLETDTSHKRALRFFDSHFRAIRFILDKIDAIFVDFHNQRLHAVIPRPYGDDDDEKNRIDRGIAISDLIIKVVEEQREVNGDDAIPAAKVRIGIDTGISLAVNNGRKHHREPLFLGDPANHAAKHSFGTAQGIFLTEKSRQILGLVSVDDTKKTKLTLDEIKQSTDRAKIEQEVTSEEVINEVSQNTKLLKDFTFSRAEPPLKDLDFTNLYYKSAKRQETLSIYADIDGFTNFVAQNLTTDEGKKNVVRSLHVLRSELDACLCNDFKGRRVRFIGDCLHGIICEGTKFTTDHTKTVDVGTEAVSGLRSSFNLSLDILSEKFDIDTTNLGLGIGYEIGSVSLTRIGKKGESTRCALGISTISSENEQRKCTTFSETRIGDVASQYLSSKYSEFFTNRSATDLTFEKIEEVNESSLAKNESRSIYDTNNSPYISTNLKAHADIKQA